MTLQGSLQLKMDASKVSKPALAYLRKQESVSLTKCDWVSSACLEMILENIPKATDRTNKGTKLQ